VQLNETSANAVNIEVKNVLGETLVATKTLNKETHIDLSGFAKGDYLIVLTQGTQVSLKQLIKQ
jgi:hypothetical protein